MRRRCRIAAARKQTRKQWRDEQDDRRHDAPCPPRRGGLSRLPERTGRAEDGRVAACRRPRGDARVGPGRRCPARRHRARSEEHTSELQSLMRISYAVFCFKKKKKNNNAG